MMFLHVGNNRNIRIRDVVGIFDMDNATVSSVTRRFLSGNQKKNLVESVAEEIPKSFVLYRDRRDGRLKIYFSQLSTSALCGRMNSFGGEDGGTSGK